MIDVAGRVFRSCTVVMDGKRFTECSFHDCTLIWRGTEEFDCRPALQNKFFDCGFRFEGAASPFIEGFLRELWRSAKPVEEDDDELHLD
jgi:hypothetical protein